MDLIQWFLLINENALQTVAQTDAGNKTEQYKVTPNTGTKPTKPKSYVSNK